MQSVEEPPSEFPVPVGLDEPGDFAVADHEDVGRTLQRFVPKVSHATRTRQRGLRTGIGRGFLRRGTPVEHHGVGMEHGAALEKRSLVDGRLSLTGSGDYSYVDLAERALVIGEIRP